MKKIVIKILNLIFKIFKVKKNMIVFFSSRNRIDGNPKEIYLYLNKTYPNSFNAISLKEWPIFVNFRESQEYQKFCAEHSEDFLSEEIVEETEQN